MNTITHGCLVMRQAHEDGAIWGERRPPFAPNRRLKAALVASGKRQYQVAHDARMKETDLSSIVRGVRRSTSTEREELSRVLGVPSDELFAGEGRLAATGLLP
jgi:hypothetical protein